MRSQFDVEAMNPGSLPVTPTSFGILRPNGSTIISRQNDCSAELPYELPAGKNLIKWLEMVPVAQSLSRAGYGGKVNLVGFYRDALGACHKSKPLEVDVAMWLRLAISPGIVLGGGIRSGINPITIVLTFVARKVPLDRGQGVRP